jgi:hypothetical protein
LPLVWLPSLLAWQIVTWSAPLTFC